MREIVYVKKVDHEREMLKKENQRIPFLISRSLFLYRSLLNRITKKKVEGSNLWILPIKKTYSERKIRCMIRKLSMSPENIYILSNDLESKPIYKMMEEYAIQYLNGTQIKKFLLIPILEYIVQIQNKELKEIELTLLINDPSEVNLYLLEKLAKIVKNVKIVSSQMYKFKKIEEKLYNEFGIAIQFSNSYQKSLAKSRWVINLDFSEIEINEYQVYDKAIIINCIENKIKIKSKLFNGIVVHSCDIKMPKEIEAYFKKINLYQKYSHLSLYESLLYHAKDCNTIDETIQANHIVILQLLGNHGVIQKKEIKNIHKKLDKS